MTRVRYQNDLPSLFNKIFNGDLDSFDRKNFSETNTTLPSVNIKESVDEYEVEVAVPGFDKSDFNIELDNNLLTISSEKRMSEEERDDEKITRREFSYQSFKRSFTLPELVEDEKISAKYENGILSITIPKKEEAKPKPIKQIEIK